MTKMAFIGIMAWLLSCSYLSAAETSQSQITDSQNLNSVLIADDNISSHNAAAEVPIFDDKMLITGYSQKYQTLPKEILVEMIKDETLNPFKTAAAIKVLTDTYLKEMPLAEKKLLEKALLRCYARGESPFVDVESMYALCMLDRYRYFPSMVPQIIQKLNHYNTAVNDISFENLNIIIKEGQNRTREARIVFNTLQKMLFLSRKRLEKMTEPTPKIHNQIQILRWSIKVLGNDELKRLPKEVIHLF